MKSILRAALVAAALSLATPALAAVPAPSGAALTCTAVGKSIARTVSACEYGAPVTVGRLLLVPKACRIPMGKGAVDRHTVEIRDGKSGAKRGQTSLPAVNATAGSSPPNVGGLIGGAYPLYVFGGGIAAVDPAGRKASLVLQSSGRLLGAVRHGEVLAVVDGLPKSKTFPAGAIEWTVLDFGTSELLGQQRLAGADLQGLGLGTEKGVLVAWLRRQSKGRSVEVFAKVRAKSGKALTKDGNLAARLRAVPKANAGAIAAPAKAGSCVSFVGTEALLVAAPSVAIRGKAQRVNATRSATRLPGVSGCIAATRAVDGKAWAWMAKGPRSVLKRLSCQATKARKAPKTK